MFNPPNLLETNWTVVTGAPSSGKTAVLTGLQKAGIQCAPEAATIHIKSRLECGQNLSNICADQQLLQLGILNQALEIERHIPTSDAYILDRSAIDTLSYCRLYGINPSPFLEQFIHKYKAVFLLDRLRFVENEVRIEDDNTASLLDQYLEEVYTELGYTVMRVPVMSVRERVEFILSHTL